MVVLEIFFFFGTRELRVASAPDVTAPPSPGPMLRGLLQLGTGLCILPTQDLTKSRCWWTLSFVIISTSFFSFFLPYIFLSSSIFLIQRLVTSWLRDLVTWERLDLVTWERLDLYCFFPPKWQTIMTCLKVFHFPFLSVFIFYFASLYLLFVLLLPFFLAFAFILSRDNERTNSIWNARRNGCWFQLRLLFSYE